MTKTLNFDLQINNLLKMYKSWNHNITEYINWAKYWTV